MKTAEIMAIVRSAVRPALALLFCGAVVIIGMKVASKLLPLASQFVDREIALIIIVGLLGVITTITGAALIIMGFYFGERSAKKKEEK